jgi:hypothetical protein
MFLLVFDGDFIILSDFLSTSLGYKVTFKAGELHSSVVRAPAAQLKQETKGMIPCGCPGFFSSS